MLKKTISVITAVIIALACAVPAFCDRLTGNYAAVTCYTRSGELTVLYAIKQDGDKTSCEERFLPPETEVTLGGEETDPVELTEAGYDTAGKVYVAVSTENGEGYIDSEYLTPAEDTYSAQSTYAVTYTYTYHVIDRDGLAVRKGPSVVYDIAGTIPYGEDFTLISQDSETSPTYGYIDCNGVSGWVYIYDYAPVHCAAYKVDSSSYFAGKLEVLTDKVYLVDINTVENGKYKRLSDNIPKGTVLKFGYYCYMNDGVAAYTEYEGKEGWVTFSISTADKTPWNIMPYVFDIAIVGKETELYEKRDASSPAAGKTVPEGTPVNVNAFYLANEGGRNIYRILVDYNGEKLWLKADLESGIGLSLGLYALAYVSADSIVLYPSFDYTQSSKSKLYYGERMNVFSPVYANGLSWYYVNTTDGGSGFIRNKEDAITTYANSSRHALRVSEDDGKTILGINEIFGDPGVNTTAPADETQAEETKEFPTQKVVIGAVAAAVVLGAVAISTVTTLKKKKEES